MQTKLTHQSKCAVLLVHLGTPEAATATAIRKFLRQFLSDPRVVELPRAIWLPILYGIVLPFRPKKLVKQYQKIWLKEGSPLRVYAEKQKTALQKQMHVQFGEQVIVKVAMCYGEPSLQNVCEQLSKAQIDRWVILPLYPQYSATTTAAVFDLITKELRQYRDIPQLRFVKNYATHPSYIHALAQSIDQYWLQHGQADRLLFSFHGIPERNVALGDPYPKQCQQTAELVAQQLDLPKEKWAFSFQSRFGSATWLQPYTDELLKKWGNDGIANVSVIAPGFAVDCLETLEELAILNQTLFLQAGGKQYHYIPALNDSLGQIQLLEQLILEQITNWV